MAPSDCCEISTIPPSHKQFSANWTQSDPGLTMVHLYAMVIGNKRLVDFMAHIVPIDRTRSLRISAAEQAPRDPFDVVIFLNHFLESDRYPDAIISQISAAKDAAPETAVRTKPTAQHHLKMHLGRKSLAFSLGHG